MRISESFWFFRQNILTTIYKADIYTSSVFSEHQRKSLFLHYERAADRLPFLVLENVIKSDEDLEFLAIAVVQGATHVNAENHVAVHDDFQAGACRSVDAFNCAAI